MTRGRLARLAGCVAGAVTLVSGLAACELPPPPARPLLTVTTVEDGVDSSPGDGACSSATVGGECTLRAAIDEANALGVADLTVPAGNYLGTAGTSTLQLTVTGDVRVNWGAPQAVGLLGHIDVRPGAVLYLDGVGRIPSVPALNAGLRATVGGALVLRHGVLNDTPRVTMPGSTHVALDVAPGGVAWVQDSVLAGWTSALRTSGAAVVLESTLLSSASSTLDASGGGQAALRSTAITGVLPTATGGCTGTAPGSLGYVHSDSPCVATPGPGDAVGPAQTTGWFGLEPTSPLIDAVPLGTAGCLAGAVDINGHPRAVDGDGDGVIACDIGAVEHQPTP